MISYKTYISNILYNKNEKQSNCFSLCSSLKHSLISSSVDLSMWVDYCLFIDLRVMISAMPFLQGKGGFPSLIGMEVSSCWS